MRYFALFSLNKLPKYGGASQRLCQTECISQTDFIKFWRFNMKKGKTKPTFLSTVASMYVVGRKKQTSPHNAEETS